MGQACCAHETAKSDTLESLDQTLGRGTQGSVRTTRIGRTAGTGRSSTVADWRGMYDGQIVNGFMKATWPLINEFSRKVLEDNVLPAVRLSLGGLADQFDFDLDAFSLGDKAVEFGDLQIDETVQHTSDPDNPDMRVVFVRTPMVWHARLTAQVALASVRIGISSMKLEGDLLMELIGSIPRPPLFQGARACFMNAPNISMEYDGEASAVSTLANFGPLKRAILAAVTEQVSNKLVVPNRMGVRMDRACEIFRIVKPRPKGILKVTFTRAEDLLALDTSIFHRATSDPFLKATCGALRFQSPTVLKTTSPVFNYDALMPIDFPLEQHIDVEVIDEDTFTNDDSLGKLPPLRVADLIALGHKEVGYDILDEKGVAGKNGKLYVKAEFRPLLIASPKATLAPAFRDAAEVFVGVYGARRLPSGPPGTKYWVTVQCSHRLGLCGHDISKPRSTAKAVEKGAKILTAEERAQQKKVFNEKRERCKKYNMSKEDMAALLDTEIEHLDTEEPHENTHRNVDWNNAMDFFVTRPHEAVLDITLNFQHVPARPGAGDQGGQAAHLGYLQRVKRAVSALPLHKLRGTKDGTELCSWQIKATEIMDKVSPDRLLEVPGTSTTLHLRLQVRSLGDITTDFNV